MRATGRGSFDCSLRHVLLLLGILVGSSACAPHSMHRNASTMAPLDSVLALYYDAVGGLGAIRAVASRRMRGTYVEGQLHASTDMSWRRPELRRVNVHAPGFDYSEGFDGVTWEYSFQRSHALLDSGAAAAAGRRGAEFDESFVDYRAKGHHVELMAIVALEGHDVIHTRVTLADGWEKDYYFNPATHLIVAMRKAMPIHATGSAVETLTHYEDWRREGGVLQPHRFVERIVKTGQVLNTLQWDRIETNVTLTTAELCPPAVDVRISIGSCATP